MIENTVKNLYFYALLWKPFCSLTFVNSNIWKGEVGQEQCDQKKSPKVYKSWPKMISLENDTFTKIA